MSPQFEQGVPRVVFVEHIAKPPRFLDDPRIGVPVVHKFQQIHFAGTESCGAVRKLFEQRNECRSKSRQDHQIRHQQIETGFWRFSSIGPPGAACRRQMVLGHLEDGQFPFCDGLRRVVRNGVVRMHKAKLARDLLVRAEQVEQPDEHELIIGPRINPHFN
jgi:hypothetical protein